MKDEDVEWEKFYFFPLKMEVENENLSQRFFSQQIGEIRGKAHRWMQLECHQHHRKEANPELLQLREEFKGVDRWTLCFSLLLLKLSLEGYNWTHLI